MWLLEVLAIKCQMSNIQRTGLHHLAGIRTATRQRNGTCWGLPSGFCFIPWTLLSRLNVFPASAQLGKDKLTVMKESCNTGLTRDDVLADYSWNPSRVNQLLPNCIKQLFTLIPFGNKKCTLKDIVYHKVRACLPIVKTAHWQIDLASLLWSEWWFLERSWAFLRWGPDGFVDLRKWGPFHKRWMQTYGGT